MKFFYQFYISIIKWPHHNNVSKTNDIDDALDL